MKVMRGFCKNKDQSAALRASGVPDKALYQDGRGAEDLARCLASFRGRSGTLMIAPDLTVFGGSRKAVAAVMDTLELAGIRVADVIHPQDKTIAAMMQRASVLIAHTGLMSGRTARRRGARGGLGKGKSAQARRDAAVPQEFVGRIVQHKEIPWRIKLEVLGPEFSAARRQNRQRSSVLKDGTKTATVRTIGYCRVSRDDQNLDMQLTAMRNVGVTDLFVEKISAVSAKRPMWHLMLKFVEAGDTIHFYAFNRLCRSVKQLLGFIDDMKALGVTLRSTTEPHIDPFTTNGRMIATITGAVDENELGRLSDRTRDGMAERKRQGMWLGRRPKFSPSQAKKIQRDRKTMSREAVARKWKCSAGTIKKYEN